jgi:hypothetical protein
MKKIFRNWGIVFKTNLFNISYLWCGSYRWRGGNKAQKLDQSERAQTAVKWKTPSWIFMFRTPSSLSGYRQSEECEDPPTPNELADFVVSPVTRAPTSRSWRKEKLQFKNSKRHWWYSGFWDIAPCSLVKVNWRFRGTYCRHHQGAAHSSPWRLRQYVHIKRRSTSTRLHLIPERYHLKKKHSWSRRKIISFSERPGYRRNNATLLNSEHLAGEEGNRLRVAVLHRKPYPLRVPK